jgi:hypothetical protein
MLEKLHLLELYEQFFPPPKKFGAFNLAESLLPIGRKPTLDFNSSIAILGEPPALLYHTPIFNF